MTDRQRSPIGSGNATLGKAATEIDKSFPT